MKKLIIATIAITLLSFSLKEEKTPTIHGYEVNLKQEKIELVWKNDKGHFYSNFRNVLEEDSTCKLLMNAGMYTKAQAPLGLYIEDSVVKHKLNKTQTAYGNFYMQPNGVFYIENDSCKVIQTKDFKQTKNIAYATQSGPMLVINGKLHPKFMKGSSNKYVRNGVGILPNGNPLFAISAEPINFYDFATFFKNKGCKNALYLDGSVSRAYIPSKNLLDKGGKFGVMIKVAKK